MTPRPTYYILLPGIHNDAADMQDWTNRAETWIETHTDARADAYRYECRWYDRFIGQGKRIDDVAAHIRNLTAAKFGVVVVAHSNGCAIATDALRLHPGTRVKALHLIAGAADPDFDRNRLNEVIRNGHCHRVTCYCSKNDSALKWAGVSRKLLGWAGLGYGNLGRVGPQNVHPVAKPYVETIWRQMDHSDWFKGDHFSNLMRLITGRLPATGGTPCPRP